MTESKFKRTVVALTVGAILLLVFLLSVVVYQLISIGVIRKQSKELKDEIAHYEALSEEAKETLDARSERWWIERRAREMGLTYPDDDSLNSK